MIHERERHFAAESDIIKGNPSIILNIPVSIHNISGTWIATPNFPAQYSTERAVSSMDRPLPERKSIDTILAVLTPADKEELLKELYDNAVIAVRTGRYEDLDRLRQCLLAWEYTAHVKADKDFLKTIEELRNEVINDSTSGVDWRELLRG